MRGTVRTISTGTRRSEDDRTHEERKGSSIVGSTLRLQQVPQMRRHMLLRLSTTTSSVPLSSAERKKERTYKFTLSDD